MTAKEKAKDIYDSYWYCLMQSDIHNRHYWSKECALILVDEIIQNQTKILDEMQYKLILGGIKSITMQSDYWNNVKRYIEEL